MDRIIRTDVCIIGGGPGGSAAALQLAKHGVRAVLIEKAVFPRDKVCGDALSGKVMRTLERLDPAIARTVTSDAQGLPSWGVTFVAPSGRSLRVPFSREIGLGEAPGLIMPRLDFDALLFEKVKAAPGIEVHEGTSARAYERTTEGWAITLEGRTKAALQCRIVLAADGANSHFARHVARVIMEPQHHAAGVRAYYSGVRDLIPMASSNSSS